MDDEGAKAKILWNLTHPEPQASDTCTDDALLEFPQSGKRFRGKEDSTPWRADYPVEIYLAGAFPPAEDRVPNAETSPPETTPGLPVKVRGGG